MMRVRWFLLGTAFVLLALGRLATLAGQILGVASASMLVIAAILAHRAGKPAGPWSPALATAGLAVLLLVPPAPEHPLTPWPWIAGLVTALAVAGVLAPHSDLRAADWVRAHAVSLAATALLLAILLGGAYHIMHAMDPSLATLRETQGAYGILLAALPVFALAAAAASLKHLIPRATNETTNGEEDA